MKDPLDLVTKDLPLPPPRVKAMTQQATPEKQVAEWNARVKVGDEVDYREFPEAAPKRHTTRTEAQVLSGHTAVVWLNGKAGCVCIEACKVLQPRIQIGPLDV